MSFGSVLSIKSTGGTLRPSGLGLRSLPQRAIPTGRSNGSSYRDAICRIFISLLWVEIYFTAPAVFRRQWIKGPAFGAVTGIGSLGTIRSNNRLRHAGPNCLCFFRLTNSFSPADLGLVDRPFHLRSFLRAFESYRSKVEARICRAEHLSR